MTTVCPICKSAAVQELDRTGDAIGFHCPTHGDFKVADPVFAGEGKGKGKGLHPRTMGGCTGQGRGTSGV